jgi:hypothetical protein
MISIRTELWKSNGYEKIGRLIGQNYEKNEFLDTIFQKAYTSPA